jgi:hypothetical protein
VVHCFSALKNKTVPKHSEGLGHCSCIPLTMHNKCSINEVIGNGAWLFFAPLIILSSCFELLCYLLLWISGLKTGHWNFLGSFAPISLAFVCCSYSFLISYRIMVFFLLFLNAVFQSLTQDIIMGY